MKLIKKWNSEMVNRVLRNGNYTGTLFQGKRRKLNYRVNKQIEVDKNDWIITPNYHEVIIGKEIFDKVQDILDNHFARIKRKGVFDNLSGFIKCNDCNGQMRLKSGKNKYYYYCTNYFKKMCTSNSIEKTKLEKMILEKLNINEITRNYLYEKVNAIYISRRDTIYDVDIPKDTETILCDESKGVYRANKIIVSNPKKITDDLVLKLYKKSTLSNKILAECLVKLVWKNRIKISKYIINDRVNKNNIDEFYTEFMNYSSKNNFDNDELKNKYKELEEMLLKIKMN